MNKLLVGNTFPMGLVRTRTSIFPISLELARETLGNVEEVVSFWGHPETIKPVSEKVGFDLTPKEHRPALGLSDNNLPSLYGKTFENVLIISPRYKGQFRPEPGTEVPASEIEEWDCKMLSLHSTA